MKLPEDGVKIEIVQRIVHPAHHPLHTKTQSIFPGGF
jgi:hypothetical protein